MKILLKTVNLQYELCSPLWYAKTITKKNILQLYFRYYLEEKHIDEILQDCLIMSILSNILNIQKIDNSFESHCHILLFCQLP